MKIVKNLTYRLKLLKRNLNLINKNFTKIKAIQVGKTILDKNSKILIKKFYLTTINLSGLEAKCFLLKYKIWTASTQTTEQIGLINCMDKLCKVDKSTVCNTERTTRTQNWTAQSGRFWYPSTLHDV